MTKKCNICNTEKDSNSFAMEKNSKDSLRHSCRDCVKEYNKKYYKKRRKDIIKQKISYQKTVGKDKKKEYDKNYRKNNPEKYKLYQEKKIKSKKFKKWRRKYEKQKRMEDPSYKLRNLVSTRIGKMLRENLGTKSCSCLDYLGYSSEDLKKHLEDQFTPQMNWDNHGTYWHIDHIVPQKLLPFSSLEDENFKKCWALDNLRPLEKKENLKKGKKTLEEYNEWKRNNEQSNQ